jgi:hypothetical protein
MRRYEAAGNEVSTTACGSIAENEYCEDVTATTGCEVIAAGQEGPLPWRRE